MWYVYPITDYLELEFDRWEAFQDYLDQLEYFNWIFLLHFGWEGREYFRAHNNVILYLKNINFSIHFTNLAVTLNQYTYQKTLTNNQQI